MWVDVGLKRYLELDLLRGIAIILMVLFHLSYDLNNFHFIHIDIYEGYSWHAFRNVIIFLFMITVGISLYIANEQLFHLKKNLYRLIKLFLVSLLITLVSYLLYPTTWIYFGIIHLIFVSSLLALPFVKYPTLSLVIGLFWIFAYLAFDANMDWLFTWSKGVLHLPDRTQDIAHLFPWLGVVFIGIFVGSKKWFDLDMKANAFTTPLSFLGRHALLIYLIHQPILVGVISGIRTLLS